MTAIPHRTSLSLSLIGDLQVVGGSENQSGARQPEVPAEVAQGIMFETDQSHDEQPW
jgi:hypothetical protein